MQPNNIFGNWINGRASNSQNQMQMRGTQYGRPMMNPQFNNGSFPQANNHYYQRQYGQVPSRQMLNQTPQNQIPINQMPINQMPPPGSGITFEPLDEKTLAGLRQSFANQEPLKEAPMMPPKPLGELPSDGSATVEGSERPQAFVTGIPSSVLEGFIQNERNASIFYRHLSNIAPRNKYKDYMSEIAAESEKRKLLLNQIYQRYKDSEYTPVESEVATNVSFYEGVSWAIEEEIKAIRDLNVLYESVEDERTARQLNFLIHNKISDLNVLHLAR